MSSVTVHALAVLQRDGKVGTPSTSLSPLSSYSFMSLPSIPSLDPRIVSGSVGSIVSSVVTTPFEVAKVKLQQHSSVPPLRTAIMTANNSHPTFSTCATARTSSSRPPPTGPFSMLRHVIAKEGIQGAYAGLAPTVLMSIPNYLLYLISYDEIVHVLRSKTSLSEETTVPLAGGAVARLIATTATAPLELLRTRQAAASHNNNTNTRTPQQDQQSIRRVWKDLSAIVRNEGIPALYKGMTPQLLRDVPFAALYMLFLERFRQCTAKPTASSNSYYSPRQEVGLEFVNAAMAGMVAATLTAPADVIKSRAQMMTLSSTNNNKKSSRSSNSMLQIVRSIVQNEGILRGLWRGNQARILKVAPQYAIMISTYDIGKKLLIVSTIDDEEDKDKDDN